MKKFTLLVVALLGAVGMNAQILEEHFDDITTLTDWDIVNVSNPLGTLDWFQGNPAVFTAFDGAGDAYIAVNFNSTAGTGTISNYLITPVLALSDGDEISFYTRTGTGSTFPDRLEVRLSTDGAASTAPANETDNGSYTTILLEINPGLTVGGYPETWTQQLITISGIGTDIDCRIAFRYFVTNGGPTGSNSNFIGIDAVLVDEGLNVSESQIAGFEHFYNSSTKDLTLSANQPFSQFNLYNILGQRVISQELSSTEEVVNLAALNTGVYLANVEINGQVASFKVVKR